MLATTNNAAPVEDQECRLGPDRIWEILGISGTL